MVGEHHGYPVGQDLHIRLAAARVDDHIDLRLIHGDGYPADQVGGKAKLLQGALDRAGGLPRPGKIVAGHVVVQLYVHRFITALLSGGHRPRREARSHTAGRRR